MSRWGKVDLNGLKQMQKNMQKLSGMQLELFFEACAKELAARLLRKVIKRTPVGIYPAGSGKVGGTLRRGWTATTADEAESGKNKNASAWAASLKVTRIGNVYQIEVINPVNYASYVEFGHRTVNHMGWVEGRFMMTISVQEIESSAPGILDKKIKQFLTEHYSD